MTIVKVKLEEDTVITTPSVYDAPPSYNHVGPSSSSSDSIRSLTPPPSRDPNGPSGSTSGFIPAPPTLPPSSPTVTSSPSVVGSPSPTVTSSPIQTPALEHPPAPRPNSPVLIETKLRSKKSKFKSSLFDFLSGAAGKSVKDIKNMAYNSVRDAVKNPGVQHSIALIETSAEMCRAKGIEFSDILQDPCIEGHRALYWTIISRPATDQYGLLFTILKHSSTLSSEAVEEVRLACLQVGDQALFSNIWRHPAYGAISPTDELVLGTSTLTDIIEVQEATTNGTEVFLTRMEIRQFRKRMNISEKITIEFLARGRLWCLKFYATPDKKTTTLKPWSVSVSIVNPSPQTWLDSRIIITTPSRDPSVSLPPWPLSKGKAVDSASVSSQDLGENPPIQFRLQTKSHQLQPSTSSKSTGGRTELVAKFSENVASSGLQHPDSAYYSSEESLQIIMEARLEKPGKDKGCVIC